MMIKKFFILLIVLGGVTYPRFAQGLLKNEYTLSKKPIDVVIPATKKDVASLDFCINGIKKNCKQVRRVIVVSPERYTTKAEWHDEKKYPFSKYEIALFLNRGDVDLARQYMEEPHSRLGWYYQQLLKLYAPFVIPEISSNVLIIDADTIFLRPVQFIGKNGEGLYNPGSEYFEFYFWHLERLLPGYKKLFSDYSGISHHMLFQKPVLKDLFAIVENQHQVEFWKAFCQCVEPKYLRAAGASEYEIYFNFVFARTDKVKIRELKWANAPPVESMGTFELSKYRQEGYHYISCHKYDN